MCDEEISEARLIQDMHALASALGMDMYRVEIMCKMSGNEHHTVRFIAEGMRYAYMVMVFEILTEYK